MLLNSDTLYESKYHQQRAEELENGIGAYKYYIESGRKYHKIWMETGDNSRSIHAFVDKVTGDVYKAASIKAPAKGVRFNLMNDALLIRLSLHVIGQVVTFTSDK